MLRTLIVCLSALALVGGPVTHANATAYAARHPGADAGFAAEVAAHGAAERAGLAAEVPAPPPAPPSVQDVIARAFAPIGPDAVAWAEQIATCESTDDPRAVNSDSGAEGLFQFLPSTWAGTPYAGADPFDPVANASAAAWLLVQYGPGQWECQA